MAELDTSSTPSSAAHASASAAAHPAASEAAPTAAAHPPASVHPARRKWIWVLCGLVLIVILIFAIPWIHTALTTVSTDDAYVSGHVTFVAPRVAGQVARVLVDDNNHVHAGDLLVQLDKEPLQVQVNIAQASVTAAQADLRSAQATVRGLEGQARSLRFKLEHAIEDVNNQVAMLRSRAAVLTSQKAVLAKAQADYDRVQPLVNTGAVTKEEIDRRQESLLVAQAGMNEALQGVYQIRVALGLPPQPPTGDDLTQVPPDLDQTFSSVRQAQASLIEAAAQLGVVDSFAKTPKQMVADFYKRDPGGDIDRIYEKLAREAPPVRQAEAKLSAARRNLDQALLNLRYADVVAAIDGVVTRRQVNPGDNVIVGQSVMGIRSITDIWVDANFKETQLASIRIGQPVDLDVDMYGGRHRFKGRVSGFTMGTGSTLALLPAENATGNFVKVVQRLPVRIDLLDYDPDAGPLFVGTSVTPKVYVKAEPTGPDAGKVLQPYLPTAAPPATQPAGEPATEPTTEPAAAPQTRP